MTILDFSYEFSWLLRLPTEDLPSATSQPNDNLLVWRRSNGNIILGFFRQRRQYPVGAKVLIVTSKKETIGYGRILKSETHVLPDGSITTVVEFTVIRLFDEKEKEMISKLVNEIYDGDTTS